MSLEKAIEDLTKRIETLNSSVEKQIEQMNFLIAEHKAKSAEKAAPKNVKSAAKEKVASEEPAKQPAAEEKKYPTFDEVRAAYSEWITTPPDGVTGAGAENERAARTAYVKTLVSAIDTKKTKLTELSDNPEALLKMMAWVKKRSMELDQGWGKGIFAEPESSDDESEF